MGRHLGSSLGAGIAGLLAVAALAGCSAVAPPPGPTGDEIAQFQRDELARWWDGIAPGEAMPQVEVQQYTTQASRERLIGQCLQSRLPDGERQVALTDVGYTMTGVWDAAVDRVLWECTARLPLQVDEVTDVLSGAQVGYAYAYFRERTLPCLVANGYDIPGPGQGSAAQLAPNQGTSYPTGYLEWNPYYDAMSGGAEQGMLEVAFTRMLDICPPPPLDYRWNPFPID